MHTFRITILTPAGRLSLRRDSAGAAIANARALEREGVGEVFITPPGGQPMSLKDFVASAADTQPPLTAPENARS